MRVEHGEPFTRGPAEEDLTDPAELPSAARGDLNPTHTMLGGRVVHGPELGG